MSKFKVGDVVQRSRLNSSGKDWQNGLSYKRRETGVVERVEYAGVIIAGWYHLKESLMLAEEELPPAPESVLYINEAQWGVQASSLGDALQIGIGNPNSLKHGWTYASLDADTALQLCHDLRRMAMSIKKKEKQHD